MSQSSAKNSWISSATALKLFIFRSGGWNVQNCLRNPLGDCFLVIFSDTFSSVFQKITFKVHSLKEEETECLLCSCVVYICIHCIWAVTLWHGFYYLNFIRFYEQGHGDSERCVSSSRSLSQNVTELGDKTATGWNPSSFLGGRLPAEHREPLRKISAWPVTHHDPLPWPAELLALERGQNKGKWRGSQLRRRKWREQLSPHWRADSL